MKIQVGERLNALKWKALAVTPRRKSERCTYVVPKKKGSYEF